MMKSIGFFVDGGHYAEVEYLFNIKANFSEHGSIIEITTNGPVITFVPDDFRRDLLEFNKMTLYEKYNLSPSPVDILSSDNTFLECFKAQAMIFRGKRSGGILNFTTDVDPGYKYIEKFRGRLQWYMMESEENSSSISFKLKTESNHIVFCNGQSITFRLSIKEI